MKVQSFDNQIPAVVTVPLSATRGLIGCYRADEFLDRGLEVRRFEPALSFGLGILYPAHRPRSLILAEFVAMFRENITPYLMSPPTMARRAG